MICKHETSYYKDSKSQNLTEEYVTWWLKRITVVVVTANYGSNERSPVIIWTIVSNQLLRSKTVGEIKNWQIFCMYNSIRLMMLSNLALIWFSNWVTHLANFLCHWVCRQNYRLHFCKQGAIFSHWGHSNGCLVGMKGKYCRWHSQIPPFSLSR